MGGKQCSTLVVVVEMVQASESHRNPVFWSRPATDLIHDNEGAGRRLVQDDGRF